MKLQGRRCQCGDGGRNGGCGEYFTTTSAFDRHRVGNRGAPWADRWCLSEFGMEAIGMFQVERGDERLWFGSRRPLEAHAGGQNRRFQAEATQEAAPARTPVIAAPEDS